MIVGRAICELFDGMTILVGVTTVTVKNNMGNQDALDKFIAMSDKKGASKYPLIFYVTNVVKEFDGWSYCNTDLIIMKNTNKDLLYKDRTDKVYTPYIEPIYNEIKTILNNNAYFQILETSKVDRYAYDDRANYGIIKNDVGNKSSTKSVVTDYVDARVIKINFRIKINCI